MSKATVPVSLRITGMMPAQLEPLKSKFVNAHGATEALRHLHPNISNYGLSVEAVKNVVYEKGKLTVDLEVSSSNKNATEAELQTRAASFVKSFHNLREPKTFNRMQG